MKSETAQRLRKIYLIALTCSILLAGVALIAGCLYLYFTGESQAFTPQRVEAVFSKIGWTVYLCLGLTIGSFFLPKKEAKKPARQKMDAGRPQKKTTVAAVRYALLGLGAVCVILGLCFDGVQAVIANAIALCMACIGLG